MSEGGNGVACISWFVYLYLTPAIHTKTAPLHNLKKHTCMKSFCILVLSCLPLVLSAQKADYSFLGDTSYNFLRQEGEFTAASNKDKAGRYLDYVPVKMRPGVVLAFSIMSKDFEPMISVMTPDADDFQNFKSNTFTLDTTVAYGTYKPAVDGEYTVIVHTAKPGSTGKFTLVLYLVDEKALPQTPKSLCEMLPVLLTHAKTDFIFLRGENLHYGFPNLIKNPVFTGESEGYLAFEPLWKTTDEMRQEVRSFILGEYPVHGEFFGKGHYILYKPFEDETEAVAYYESLEKSLQSSCLAGWEVYSETDFLFKIATKRYKTWSYPGAPVADDTNKNHHDRKRLANVKLMLKDFTNFENASGTYEVQLIID